MPRSKPGNLAKPKHPDIQRDTMDDIRELEASPNSSRNDIQYREPNRDRARGEADRTGRHFDEESSDASEDHDIE
jgi:hypothetical protein